MITGIVAFIVKLLSPIYPGSIVHQSIRYWPSGRLYCPQIQQNLNKERIKPYKRGQVVPVYCRIRMIGCIRSQVFFKSSQFMVFVLDGFAKMSAGIRNILQASSVTEVIRSTCSLQMLCYFFPLARILNSLISPSYEYPSNKKIACKQ